jgi:putative membrane protein
MGAAQELAVAKAQVKLPNSAGKLTDSAVQQTDSADRRTELAADRTVPAVERTYADWVRTGLAALASGIGARALLDKVVASWLVGLNGSVPTAFSAFCFAAAVWRQITRVSPPRPDTRRILALLLRAVNGFLVLASLAALVRAALTASGRQGSALAIGRGYLSATTSDRACRVRCWWPPPAKYR